MFDLYNIVTGAQGGRALANLAQQFGVSREQADAAVKALLPALSTAFMTKAAHPGGMQELMGAIGEDQHRQAYADPGAAVAPTTRQKGGDLANGIFGSNAIVEQVIQQASHYCGLPVATLQQMLPVLTSIIVGGVATAMNNQGLGSMLGQFAGRLDGGPGAPTSGGFGGMFGTILSSMLGGMQHASPQQPTPQAAPAPSVGSAAGPFGMPGGMPGMPPAFQAGMDALSKMFQPGVQPPHPTANADLSERISTSLNDKE